MIISSSDQNFTIYTDYTKNEFIHSYLKFKFYSTDTSHFKGFYSCETRLESEDIEAKETYSSERISIEILKKGNENL